MLSAAALTTPGAPSEAATIVARCDIPQPCAVYKNSVGWGFQAITTGTSGFHAGLQGADVSTNGGSNDGVLGSVLNGGYGVEGTSGDGASGGVMGLATTGYGVLGESTSGEGVTGSSASGAGVFGISQSYAGVLAESKASIGMLAYSDSAQAMLGVSQTGFGVEGTSATTDAGHFSSLGAGTGVAAISQTGYALYASTGGSVGAYVVNTNGNGTDVTGSYIGLLGRSNTFPLTLTNSVGANLFYVDGSGNVYSHGTYRTFAKTRAGGSATAYSTQTTTPNVEDVGSAELVNGSALVKFDPAFAASIDLQGAYHVFLTPGGDTRGLFIATKTPSGFLVRETQGGRNTLTFDYRIVAQAAGQAHERMTLVNAATASEPKAPKVTYRPSVAPTIDRLPIAPTTRAGRPSYVTPTH